MKHLLLITLLLGASISIAYGQGAEQKEITSESTLLAPKTPIKDLEPLEPAEKVLKSVNLRSGAKLSVIELNSEAISKSVESPEYTVAMMVRQILGELYTEVLYIPESQWFELEPIAEEYVTVLFETREMSNRGVATKLAQEALTKYRAAIDAKLTAEQKNTRKNRQAEEEEKQRQQTQQFLSIKEEILQTTENVDDSNRKSFKIEFK